MMRGFARAAILAAIVPVAVFSSTGAATACSCLPPQEPVEELAAEGAVIVRGLVMGKAAEVATMSYRYSIAVNEGVNYEGPDRIEVRTANQSAACGVALTPGETVVLRLSGEAPIYGINLCSQISLGQPDWEAFFATHGD